MADKKVKTTSKYAGAGLTSGQLLLGFMEARNEYEVGAYQDRVAQFNAKSLEQTADQVVVRGEEQAIQMRSKGNRILGAQKAGYAAQGVDTSTGTAAAVQAETEANMIRDEYTIKNNAFLEAFGLKTQAISQREQGAMAKIAGQNRANQSLVNAGLQGAMIYEKYG